jgi:adenylylsulfate kinase
MSFNVNETSSPVISSNVVRHQATITRAHREKQHGHKGAVIWFTGLSGSGKSTLAHAVEDVLHQRGYNTFVLDGDNVRHGLCGDLGFSASDRHENIRRIGEVAKLFIEAGVIVLTAFISPFRADRGLVRELIGDEDFMEVYCDAPLTICEERDIKGLYKKARSGQIAEFTGISSPYEEPVDPDMLIKTGTASIDVCVSQVIHAMSKKHIFPMDAK